jgi:glucose-6-phosphate isomerase
MLKSSDADTLSTQASRLRDVSISDLLSNEANRVSQLTFRAAGLSLDASKQKIDRAAYSDLVSAATNAGLPDAFERLVTGVEVNITEQRAALHTLLRGTAATDCP